METIITLLIVLLPIVFKLIGKALENASAGQSVPPLQQEPQTDVSVTQRQAYRSVFSRTEAVAPVEDDPVVDSPVEPVQTVQAAAEDKPKRKKKIDPKKLIVYSEIMKPKY